MSDIHFIWCGPNKGGMCIDTPNLTARVFRNNKVHFWCFQQYKADFAEALESIQIHTIESLFTGFASKFGTKNGLKMLAEVADVVKALDAQKAFSAVKDLVCLMVLYEYGGYYLDTTTSVVGSAGMAPFSSKIEGFKARENTDFSKSYDGPRFPFLCTKNGNGWQKRPMPGLQTGLAIVGGALTYRTDQPYLLIDAPIIDVWAAYAPAGHAAVELMVVSYLSRANRLGLNSSKQPINFDGWDGWKELSNTKKDSVRDDIIGELVMGAVYDGLLNMTGGDAKALLAYTWDAFEGWESGRFPPSGLVAVPELGIAKEYKNSWRIKS